MSVGGGGIIAYSAYMKKSASIPRTALVIAAANVSVDLLAGLTIFPIVFAYGLKPSASPGLLFETLPVAFGQLPGGIFFGSLFFMLVLFAALHINFDAVVSGFPNGRARRCQSTNDDTFGGRSRLDHRVGFRILI